LKSLPFSQAGNPLDIAGYMTAGPRALENSLRYLAGQPNIDAVVLSQGEMGDAEFEAVSKVAAGTAKPVYYGGVLNPRYAQRLREIGVVQFELPSRMLRALDVATPSPASPPAAGASEPASSDAGTACALQQLRGYGDLALVSSHPVNSVEEAVAIQRNLGVAIVLKAESEVISHKSEHGLVSPPVREQAVAEAYGRLLEARRTSPDPQAQIVAQPHVSGAELALGAYRDSVFGPTVMVASGGIFLEILDDALFAAAPIDAVRAEAMIRGLRGFALLAGARGRPSSDISAAARALATLSRFIVEHTEYDSIDVNPLIVREEGAGAVAVDILAIRRRT
jgi:acyl-CoA synthetase (NDP forming)